MVALLLIVYYAVNTRGSFRFHEIANYMNYNMLAEAMLSGQLHLKEGMHPERAKASDPSDPRLPFPFILDAIAFGGQYYFLQQPLPALFHALCILVFGRPLPTGMAVVLSTTACLGILGMILWRMRETFFSGSPPWIFWFTWLSFGLSGAQLYIVSRSVVYHETITFGIMFVLLGTLLFVYATTSRRNVVLFMAMSGICFGAALACKVNLGLYPLCFFLCWAYFSIIEQSRTRVLISQSFYFLFPVGCFSVLLLGYNYLRFGAFFDFGRQHCGIGWPEFYEYCCLKGHFFRLDHIPQNLYNYFCSLPTLVHGRNFVFPRYGTHIAAIGDVLTTREELVSLPVMMPALTLLALIPFTARHMKRIGKLPLIVGAGLLSSLSMFIFFTFYVWAAGRFVYEFTPLLFIAIFCAVSVVWDNVRDHGVFRALAVGGLVLLFAANAFMGLVSAMNGWLQWPG